MPGPFGLLTGLGMRKDCHAVQNGHWQHNNWASTFGHMQVPHNMRYAVFLDGPIGVGKTTFGQLLAIEFGGGFIDGDHHSKASIPWFASSLSTSRNILQATLNALSSTQVVFVAYPIRCASWTFFETNLRRSQIIPALVGLQARPDSIADVGRHRRLSRAELIRSSEMIAQGYGSREYSNLFVQTDVGTLHDVVQHARVALQQEVFKPM